MQAFHCYQNDSCGITIIVYKPENYQNDKQNFGFPAVGYLLRLLHETSNFNHNKSEALTRAEV